MHQTLEVWLQQHERLNRTSKYPKMHPRNIRELYRATGSRSVRKAIDAGYVLNEEQWEQLAQEWRDYIASQGICR